MIMRQPDVWAQKAEPSGDRGDRVAVDGDHPFDLSIGAALDQALEHLVHLNASTLYTRDL